MSVEPIAVKPPFLPGTPVVVETSCLHDIAEPVEAEIPCLPDMIAEPVVVEHSCLYDVIAEPVVVY